VRPHLPGFPTQAIGSYVHTTVQTPLFDWRPRAKASLIHLGGSAVVALIAAVLVYGLWYPPPFDGVAGGSGLFALIVSVDVVMGPMLTFAVFDRRKPLSELKRDLAIIVAMQLAALGYGLHTMFIARPVAMALEGSRLRIVTAIDVVVDELPLAPEGLRRLPLTGPRLLNTANPTTPDEKLKAIELALAGNDLGTRPKYWRAWDDSARSEALANAKPLASLQKAYPQRKAELDKAVAKTGRPAEELRYLPVISRFVEVVALIDARSGDVVGYAPFEGYF
jgi:hypothetical protein